MDYSVRVDGGEFLHLSPALLPCYPYFREKGFDSNQKRGIIGIKMGWNAMTPEKIKNAQRTSLYLHLAVMASLLLYISVVELLGTRIGPTSVRSDYLPTLRFIFYGITIVVIFTIRRMNSLFKFWAKQGKRERNLPSLLKLSVISSLLCEIPALLGLIYFLLKGVRRDFYYLIILSGVLLFMNFPKYSRWQPLIDSDE